MQISRMPIPADDCANNEMSVDVNPSDVKSDLDSTTKVNGDNHKKLNGSVADDNSKEAHKASEIEVKKEEETKPINNIEPLSESSDELMKNGTPDKQVSGGNIEETNNEEEVPIVNNDKPNNDDKLEDNNIPVDNQDKDDEVKPMEIEQTEDVTIKEELEDIPVKKELQEVEEPVVVEIQETEKLNNGETNQTEKVIKKEELETNPVNGDTRLSDEEKSIKSEKAFQKVPEEEDMSSEISADTLSPKQVPT